MADDPLARGVKKHEGMKVAPSTRPSELLGRDSRFKSSGDVAADRATDENINAEWRRGMEDIAKGLKDQSIKSYCKGGKVISSRKL